MSNAPPLLDSAHHFLAHSEHPVLLIFAVVVIALFVLSKIPGLEHIVKPLVGAVFKIIEAIVSLLWSWAIYSGRTLFQAHLTFLKHLILPASAIDPTDSMRREAEKQ
ncbi:MAG: hypothetical protein ACP5P4_10595 [Steroidobacteraceae bacterium]